MTQKTFQDFTTDTEELWSFDEYGPTADEPLPYGVAAFPPDYYQLIERGFSWGTLAEESPSPDAEIHPDDHHRPGHHPDDEESVIAEDLARKGDRQKQSSRGWSK